MSGQRILSACLVLMISAWSAAADTVTFIEPHHDSWAWPMVKVLDAYSLYIEPGDPFADPPIPTTLLALNPEDLSEAAVLELPAGRPYDVETISNSSVAIGLVHADAARGKDAGKRGVVVARPGSAEWSHDVTVEKAGIVAIVAITEEGLQLQNQIRSPQPVTYGKFGFAVAAQDGWLAIGENGAAQVFRIDTATGAASHFLQVDHAPGEPVEVSASTSYLLTAGNAETCCGGNVSVHFVDGNSVDQIAQINAPIHAQATNFGATLVAVSNGFLIGGPGVNLGDAGGLQSGTLDYYTTLDEAPAPASRFVVPGEMPATGFGARHWICTSGDYVGALIGSNLIIMRQEAGTWSEIGRRPIDRAQGAVDFDCEANRFVIVSHDRSNGARRWRVWTIPFDEIW